MYKFEAVKTGIFLFDSFPGYAVGEFGSFRLLKNISSYMNKNISVFSHQ